MSKQKIGRNDPCPCGSGKKFKQCCQQKSETARERVSEDESLLGQLHTAVQHHQAGRLDQAEAMYLHIVAAQPNNFNALHLLGEIAMQRGDYSRAIELIRLAIKFNPAFPVAYYNLGNAYRLQGRLAEAIDSYQQTLTLSPDYAEAHYNMGIALYDQGKPDLAIACYRNTLRFRPNHARAYHNLGISFYDQGEVEMAVASFRQALALDPSNQSAAHLLDALTSGSSERSPSQYVEKLFDGYADKFETHLVKSLQYSNPAELVALVTQAGNAAPGQWDVLDLGCGTGLVAAEIAPFARQLVGVDLSANMIAKAQQRQLYHRLVKSDLLPMMRAEAGGSYDVIFGADVFVYFGKLDEIVFEAERLLRPGGFFAFTVEAIEALGQQVIGREGDPPFRLNASGRYAHSATYLSRLASSHGFKQRSLTSVPLRIEKSLPLQAWMVLWQR